MSNSFAAGVNAGNLSATVGTEISGCAASRGHQGVFWVHNDSGDSARIFAISGAGAFLGTYNLSGAYAADYEDIAVGPGPVSNARYIYVGDIGDNYAVRNVKHVYRAMEPSRIASSGTLAVDDIGLVYPDGRRDAETLMVDPANGDIYVVSKPYQSNTVYRFKAPMKSGNTYTGQVVAYISIPWLTGGDISADGSRILMRDGYKNYMWTRRSGETIAQALSRSPVQVPSVGEPQGEAICWGPAGAAYYTTSEGSRQPFYFFAGR
jgi:hypothetical protein